MSIEIHCPYCEKSIRAPDDAGGRRGKCPYCEQSVYIPMAESQVETLEVEPLDEAEERRERELLEETRRLQSAVLHERDTGESAQSGERKPGGATTGGASSGAGRSAGEVVDVPGLVIAYVEHVQQSNLEQAEQIVERLKRHSARAKDEAQRLMFDELPPASLASMPPKLLKAFLQKLIKQL